VHALKAVVIVLAVLIVVALVAVIWAIFNLDKTADTRPPTDSNIAEWADPVSLGLPAGCKIVAMELDGRRLAVRTEGPPGVAECERIYIVDLSRGNVVGTVER
jgi:hypothetical protein